MRLQVSDLQDRLEGARFDERDLPRERGDGEVGRLARAGLVEAAGGEHAPAVSLEVHQAEHLLADLADGVVAARLKARVRADRHLVGRDLSVLLAGAGDVKRGLDPGLAGGFHQVELAEDVDPVGRPRVFPGVRHGRLRRQVENRVRLRRVEHRPQEVDVVQVGDPVDETAVRFSQGLLLEADTVDLGAPGAAQLRDQVRSHETVRPGNEYSLHHCLPGMMTLSFPPSAARAR